MNGSLTLSNLIQLALALGSMAVWAWALSQIAANRPLLPRLPRRNVPWRGLEVAVVIGLMMLGPTIQLAGNFFGFETVGEEAKSQSITLDILVISSLLMLVFVALIVIVLRVIRRASWEDMGIGGGRVAGEIGIGAVGFLAALLPVYSILYGIALIYPVDEAQHQILRLLKDNQDAATVAAALFSAVIVAPIVEEFLFRAFFQGWLEARFFQGDDETQPKLTNLVTDNRGDNPYSSPADPLPGGDGLRAIVEKNESTLYHVPNPVLAIPPILISSTLFAAAHFDNWPAPIPLFALAVILGTIYHRTHRLLPCVVLHMLFNGLSLALVWYEP